MNREMYEINAPFAIAKMYLLNFNIENNTGKNELNLLINCEKYKHTIVLL